MYLGVDYYPEHWDHSMIDSDLSRMKEMGANMIRIGEFAWHLMEKSDGEFDFHFFDYVLNKARQYGMMVMFGTPTATFPAWLGRKHPDIFIVDENGQKMAFGGRRQYCYNSPEYRKYSLRIAEKLVFHYREEEAIVSWQVDNELGHEGSDMCYCGECHKGFTNYLENSYESIDELNEKWGTIFWGQTYNSFDEVPLPTKTITVHNPSLLLDWARFRSKSLADFAHAHIELVKERKGSHQTVTTNLPGGFFQKWFDHNEFSRSLDFVSYDNYPVWGGMKEPVTPAFLSMSLDYVRGLKKENFWIVEQLMGAQGHDVIGYLPRPNQAKAWSYHAFAHGCTNMLYFRWRGMTRGAEQNCYGILDGNNQKTRKFHEVKSFFNDIQKYEDILNTPYQAEVAVLYDFDNIWSWRSQRENPQFDFTSELMRLYTPFHRLNAGIDVIRYDLDFSQYKVVVVPVMKVIDEELAARLEDFAKKGGTVIMSYRAGVRDKTNNLRFGEMIPGPLSSLLGIEVHEAESLHEGQSASLLFSGKEYSCTHWRDMVHPTDAMSLASYSDSFYNEYSAVTVNSFGKGKAYYIGAGVEEDLLNVLVSEIAGDVNLNVLETNPGVEVVRRTSEEQEYAIVINHNGTAEEFNGESIEPYGCSFYHYREEGVWTKIEATERSQEAAHL
ncbi:beta-galactosidase [Fictibacillus fluitans]|uniref:Beta-galactosidase n=1 Tax=Fictibacillus fluitans TaxID=3058422 RepID=A0ABT8HTT1_9BACL|nr:beta-galactosidase [Fictibacillus sp. NE201]MDN4523880.1 beta-galactosidase [Fictibacillus sp. NE201]